MSAFDELLAQARAAQTTPTTAPKQLNYKVVPQATTQATSAAPKGVLGHIVDILSRPEYMVTNFLNQVGNDVSDVRHGTGSVLGDIGKTIAAPVEGLLGSNPAHKITGSQLINNVDKDVTDHTLDQQIGKTAADVVEGVGGFAADILLDPTTYFGGGLIKDAAEGAIKGGAKVLGKVAETGVLGKTVKDASAAVREAATKAGKLPTIDKDGAQAAEAADSAENAIDTAPTPIEGAAESIDASKKMPTPHEAEAVAGKGTEAAIDAGLDPDRVQAATEAVTKDAPKLSGKEALEQAISTPKGKDVVSTLAKLADVAKKSMEETPVPTKLTPRQWLSEVSTRVAGDREEQYKVLEKNPSASLPDLPGIKIGGGKSPEHVDFATAKERFEGGGADRSALGEGLQRAYRQYEVKFNQAAKSGRAVDAFGRPADSAATGTAGARFVQGLASLRNTLNAGDSALSKTFSTPVVKALSTVARNASDDDLANFFGQLHGALTGTTTLSNFLTLGRFDRTAATEAGETIARRAKVTDFAVNKTTGAPKKGLGALLQHMGMTDEGVQALSSDIRNSARNIKPKTEEVANGLTELAADDLDNGTSDIARDAALEAGATPDTLTAVQRLAGYAAADAVKEAKLDPASWAHTLKDGVKKDTAQYGAGYAAQTHQLNQFFQYTVWNKISRPLTELAKAKNLGGVARAKLMRETIMPALRLTERFMEAHGAPLTIGVGDAKVQMGLSQIIDTLMSGDESEALKAMFNGTTFIPPTNLMDAVQAAITGHFDLPVYEDIIVNGRKTVRLSHTEPLDGQAAIEAALSQTRTKWATADGASRGFENWYRGTTSALDDTELAASEERSIGKARRYSSQKFDIGENAGQLGKLIADNTDEFRRIAQENAAEWSDRVEGETKELTEANYQALSDAVDEANVGNLQPLVQGISDTSSRIAKQAVADGDTYDASAVANTLVKSGFGDGESPSADILIDGAAKLAKPGITKDEAALVKRETRSRLDNIGGDAERRTNTAVAAKGEFLTLGDKIQAYVNGGFLRKTASAFSRAVNFPDLHESLRKTESVWHLTLGTQFQRINALQRAMTTPETEQSALQAWRALQHGEPRPDGATGELYDQLQEIGGVLFGYDGNPDHGLYNNAWFREQGDLSHANKLLDYAGLPEEYHFDLDKAARDASKSGRSVHVELANQWRDHNFTQGNDLVDYFAKQSQAFMRMTSHQTIADSFHQVAKDMGAVRKISAGDDIPDGYVALRQGEGKSVLAPYLDPSYVYKRDIAMQLARMDAMVQDSFDKSTPFWKFINGQYRPVLDLWKQGMTIYNPSHHIRNLIGDTVLTYQANGAKNFGRAHKIALGIMARSGKNYDGYDMVRALRGEGSVIKSSGTAFKTARHGDWDIDEVYKYARDSGLLPEHNQIEQLEELDEEGNTLATTRVQKINQALHNSLPGRTAGKVSEARDHYSRMGHFVQFIMNNDSKFKDRDALMAAAAKSTRKWHPDGSDMTKWEGALRLVIPFYSWTRKTIPLVLESMLTHPNRVNVFPKASFDLATATGVNPQSFGDPYPADQLFPSYITGEGFGPQIDINGKYYGIQPGIPSVDILTSTVAGASDNPLKNIGSGILDQLAPAIKVPVELSTGTSLSTGGDINDTSDYIDSQLPGVNKIAALTGYSPTGTVWGLLNGTGPQQQYQIAQGNKQHGPTVSLLNELLGLGLTPMSQPNQINYAEIEKRNAAGATQGG